MPFQNQNTSTQSNFAKEPTVVTVLYEVVELDWVRLKKNLGSCLFTFCCFINITAVGGATGPTVGQNTPRHMVSEFIVRVQ